MKKIFKLVAVAALFATSVFTGCNNYFSNDIYYGNADGTVNLGEKNITITATTQEGMILFNGTNSRTLLPTHLKSDDLAFYLGQKMKGAADFTWKSVTFVPANDGATPNPTPTDATGSTGTVTENFVLGSYDFILYAVPSAEASSIGATPSNSTNIEANAVFVGYAAADLRYNDVVNFYLTSNNLTGSGYVNFSIRTLWSVPDDYTVNVGIYDYSTDVQKYPSGGDGTLTTKTLSANPSEGIPNDIPKAVNENNWAAGGASIASGSYNIKVTFHNTKTDKDYIYSEKVIVLPNRTTTGLIDIPEIIDRAPTQPADLIVGYSKPEAADINYYKVEFAWTDTAYNEKQFQLEIMSVDNASSTPVYFKTPTNNTEWESLVADTGLKKESTVYVNQIKSYSPALSTQKLLSESQYAVEGSLNMNNDHIVIYLPMEHRYVARIRASNDTYDTDWTYANLHSATKKTAGCAKGDSITVGSNTFITKVATSPYPLATATDILPADVTSINQFKITYNLAGGTFVGNTDFENGGTAITGDDLPSTTTTSSSVPHYTFESQHTPAGAVSTTHVPILTPDAKAANPGVLPPIAAHNGTPNTYIPQSDLYTSYATQTSKTAYLELTDADGYYWKEWWIDGKYEAVGAADSTNKFKYPVDATDVCEIYTGYTNLNLFAVYDVLPPSADVVTSVELADISKYELKPEYVRVKLNNSTTDITDTIIGAAAADPNTFKNMPRLIEFQYGTVSTIHLEIQATDLKDANNTAFTYDTVNAIVTVLTPNNYREKLNSKMLASGSNWAIDINGVDKYNAGIYYIEVQASSKKYPLVTFSQKITIKITDE